MTSQDLAAGLLHRLCFLGDRPETDGSAASCAFAVDFDSDLVWPDFPFDTAAPSNRYPDASRPAILGILATSTGMLAHRAPRAYALVNTHLQHALLRQSSAIDGASSSSNRALVGYCTLTNIHLAPDRVPICIEALVHESIHQFLYRAELDHGNFCDLGEAQRFSSPWSGARIPLHSLIHASFVWFGLLTLWTQFVRAAVDQNEASFARERIARCLFGFTFLPALLRSPRFPGSDVEPRILELIAHMAGIAPVSARFAAGHATLAESLRFAEGPDWTAHVVSSLEHVDRCWQ